MLLMSEVYIVLEKYFHARSKLLEKLWKKNSSKTEPEPSLAAAVKSFISQVCVNYFHKYLEDRQRSDIKDLYRNPWVQTAAFRYSETLFSDPTLLGIKPM